LSSNTSLPLIFSLAHILSQSIPSYALMHTSFKVFGDLLNQ
jgi:hypothetical protein